MKSHLKNQRQTKFIFLNDPDDEDAFAEYIYQDNTWEKIGVAHVDLNNYWDKANLEVATDADIDAALGVEGE